MHPRIKTLIIKPKNQIKNAIGLYFEIIEFCFFSCLWLPSVPAQGSSNSDAGLEFPFPFPGQQLCSGI